MIRKEKRTTTQTKTVYIVNERLYWIITMLGALSVLVVFTGTVNYFPKWAGNIVMILWILATIMVTLFESERKDKNGK